MNSKNEKELTIEEEAQKFHEMHPDFPNFDSPAEEHLYLLNMLDEKNKEISELKKELGKLNS